MKTDENFIANISLNTISHLTAEWSFFLTKYANIMVNKIWGMPINRKHHHFHHHKKYIVMIIFPYLPCTINMNKSNICVGPKTFKSIPFWEFWLCCCPHLRFCQTAPNVLIHFYDNFRIFCITYTHMDTETYEHIEPIFIEPVR